MISFVFLYSLNAFSVTVDGIHNNSEWDGATATQLLSGETNSKVNYALVNTVIEPDENALYLCFMFIDPDLQQDNTRVGVSLSVENSDLFDVTVADSPSHSDNSDYSFDGAITINENGGATCEIRAGFKNGLPRKINATVRFTDSEGTLSNICPFSIINDYFIETTELIISQNVTETEKASSDSIKTTKEKTTKKKTTTYKEEKTTDYTLKPKTTKPEKIKTEFYIQTSPPYSYVRKTKAPKTTRAMTSSASTKPKTVVQKPAKVYYYEKEVIISEVYVTADETSSFTALTTVHATTQKPTVGMTEIPSSTVITSFSLSKGTTYKVLIGALAVLSFTALAVFSSVSSKKFNKQ